MADAGAFQVQLTGGEIGLRGPGLVRTVETAANLGLAVILATNGYWRSDTDQEAIDRDMAPFVENADDNETYQAMEALIYNLNSMHSRAGAQVPFSSINLGAETNEAARRVTRNLLLAHEKGLGMGETPIFPNIIFRVKEGINYNPTDRSNYCQQWLSGI